MVSTSTKFASESGKNFCTNKLLFLALGAALRDNDNVKQTFIIGGVLLLCAGIAAYFLLDTKPDFDTVVVTRGSIVQEVSAHGQVKAPTQADLYFKESSKLARLHVAVGERVEAGQTLAVQDTTQLDAQVAQAQGTIDIEKTRLGQLLAGASPEAVTSAQAALETAQDQLADAIRDAYTKADDAVRNRADKLFKNPETSSASFGITFTSGGTHYSITTTDNTLRFKINQGRVAVEALLDARNTVSPSSDDAKKVEQDLATIELLLYNISLAINGLTAGDDDANTVYETFKSSISTARTNVSAARSGVVVARAGLISAQKTLEEVKAPVRETDIALYQAQIRQAEAALEHVQTLKHDTVLTAPSSGVVTDVNGEVGEVVGPGTTVVSIMTGTPEIEADLSEANIAKVSVGQPVRITLDSFNNDDSWSGEIIEIDPAGTTIGGNVYYKTKIVFTEPDERIKIGMTANVYIQVAARDNALMVPVSALLSEDGARVVRVMREDTVVSVPVETGIESKGKVEIISGLIEGDQVILSL